MVRQLASLLGAIVLVSACARNDGEVAQIRAEAARTARRLKRPGLRKPVSRGGSSSTPIGTSTWPTPTGSGLKRLERRARERVRPLLISGGAKIAYRYRPGEDVSAPRST